MDENGLLKLNPCSLYRTLKIHFQLGVCRTGSVTGDHKLAHFGSLSMLVCGFLSQLKWWWVQLGKIWQPWARARGYCYSLHTPMWWHLPKWELEFHTQVTHKDNLLEICTPPCRTQKKSLSWISHSGHRFQMEQPHESKMCCHCHQYIITM